MDTQNVKGFRDYSGEDAQTRAEIRKILVDTFEKYGFEPAETPVVEYENFVKGDNEKDEAVSDIFKLKDKRNRELALRYEFTFQLKRLMQNRKMPFKRYQIGEVFRDEPVSGNRFRQFVQCDADIVGTQKETFRDEAEILSLTSEALGKLGIDFVIYFNNRKLLNEVIEREGITKNKRDIIREIDKMDKLSEKEIKENLKKLNAEKLVEIFKKPESFFKKYTAYNEIENLKNYLKIYGIEKKIKFNPVLARGLSYYNGIVFEVKTLKMKETITAGGSYEFNRIQCTGISFGLDRLSALAKLNSKKDKYLVISLEKDKEAVNLAEKLRKKGKIISLFYGKPSKALEYANSYKYNNVIFVGEKEVKSKKFKIKNMETGRESLLKI